MRQLGKDEPWEDILDSTSDETEREVGFFNRMAEIHKNVPEAEVGLPSGVTLEFDDNSEEVEVGPEHDVRKTMLINHFNYCAHNKMIKWPRYKKKWQIYNPNKRNV